MRSRCLLQIHRMQPTFREITRKFLESLVAEIAAELRWAFDFHRRESREDVVPEEFDHRIIGNHSLRAERTVDLVTSFVGADGALESRTSSLTQQLEDIAENQAALETRIEAYRARLVSQFSAADSLISQLNNTRDYVTQQFEALLSSNSD